MSVKEVFLLPMSIRGEIHELMEYDDIDPKDIMRMIRRRYPKKLNFSVNDLIKYVDIIKAKSDSKGVDNLELLPSPVEMLKSSKALGKDDNKLDNSPMVDYRNTREIMDMFRQDIVDGFSKLKQLKSDAYKRNEILNDIEQLTLGYIKIGMDLVEKESKLKLEMTENTKNLEYIKEEIRKMLMIVKNVLKGNLNEHKYREVMEALAKSLELYKFKL